MIIGILHHINPLDNSSQAKLVITSNKNDAFPNNNCVLILTIHITLCYSSFISQSFCIVEIGASYFSINY